MNRKNIPSRDDHDQPATKGDVMEVKDYIDDLIDDIKEDQEEKIEEAVECGVDRHEINCPVYSMWKLKGGNKKMRKFLMNRPDFQLVLQAVVTGLVIGLGTLFGWI